MFSINSKLLFLTIITLFAIITFISCTGSPAGDVVPIEKPALIAPENNASELLAPITLDWAGTLDSYTLMYSDDYSALQNSTGEVEQTNTSQMVVNVSDGTWFWKVKGKKNGIETTYTDIRSFSVGFDSPPVIEEDAEATVTASLSETDEIILTWPEYKSENYQGDYVYYEYFIYEDDSEMGMRSNRLIENATCSTNSASFTPPGNTNRFKSTVLAKNGSNMQAIVGNNTFSKDKAADNRPPVNPYGPTPSKRENGVGLNPTLAWKCYDPDGNALEYDVYFGETVNAMELVAEQITEKTYNPGPLEAGQEYFWRIIVRESDTDKQKEKKSPIWSFETMGTDSYRITVQSTPSIAGDVRIGKGKWGYKDSAVVGQNEQVTLEYREDKDYIFAGWYDQGQLIGENNKIDILVNEDKAIFAKFIEEGHTPPTIEKLSFQDGVIHTASITFIWSADDEDGEIDHYAYSKERGDWQTTQDTSYTWDDYSTGTHVFSVKAIDDDENESDVIRWDFTYTIEPATYTVTVESSPVAGGFIRVHPGEWVTEKTVIDEENTELTIEASPNSDYIFEGWQSDNSVISDANPYTFLIDSDQILKAVFTAIPKTSPTVQKVDGPGEEINENTATFQWSGTDGSGERVISKYQYKKNEDAWMDMNPLTATTYTWNEIAEGEHTFSVRAVDDEGSQSNVVTWSFTYIKPEFTLTIEASPTEGGTVSNNGSYHEGTEVTIQATPNTGYQFVNWTKDDVEISKSTKYTYEMPAENVTLVANFKIQEPPVEPSISTMFNPGPKPGNLLPETFDIVVRAAHPDSKLVYLNAALNLDGSVESLWSEEATSNGTQQLEVGEDNLTVDLGEQTERNIYLHILVRDIDGNTYSKQEIYTVYKSVNEYTLTIEASHTEGGEVSGSGDYEAGETVNISATANTGYQFVNWTKDGEEISTSADYTYEMPAKNVTLVANFKIHEPSVEPSISTMFNPGPKPGGLLPETFDIVVRATHPDSELVYLKAELFFEGSVEDFWSEEATSTGSSQLEVGKENLSVDLGEAEQKNIILHILVRDIDGNTYSKQEIYTVYKTVNEYTLTIEASPTEGGEVSFDSTTWTDNAAKLVEEGTDVDIYARATDGYTFEGWYEEAEKITSDNPVNFAVNADKNYKAFFSLRSMSLQYLLENYLERNIIIGCEDFYNVKEISVNLKYDTNNCELGEITLAQEEIGEIVNVAKENDSYLFEIHFNEKQAYYNGTVAKIKVLNVEKVTTITLDNATALFVDKDQEVKAKIQELGKTFVGQYNSDEAIALEETSDRGLIIAGCTNHMDWDTGNSNDSNVWILKLSDDRKIEWQKTYGGSVIYSIKETSDGGYIAAGYNTFSIDGDCDENHGSSDFWILKIAANGEMEWQRCLGGSQEDYSYSILETKDTGFITVGLTKSGDGQVQGNHSVIYEDIWVVKLNSEGEIEWSECYGGTGEDSAHSIIEEDDGFIIFGHSNSLVLDGQEKHDDKVRLSMKNDDFCWVLKIDNQGNVEWHKSYENDESIFVSDAEKTEDGGFLIGGTLTKDDGSNEDRDFWFLKINKTGDKEWEKTYGGSGYEGCHSIEKADDGNIIAIGPSKSNDGDIAGNHGSVDGCILKLDADGEILWQKSIGGSYGDPLHMIKIMENGNYLLAGFTFSNDGDVESYIGNSHYCRADYWIIEIDNSGDILWENCYDYWWLNN